MVRTSMDNDRLGQLLADATDDDAALRVIARAVADDKTAAFLPVIRDWLRDHQPTAERALAAVEAVRQEKAHG
jgi:hypothetical protein